MSGLLPRENFGSMVSGVLLIQTPGGFVEYANGAMGIGAE